MEQLEILAPPRRTRRRSVLAAMLFPALIWLTRRALGAFGGPGYHGPSSSKPPINGPEYQGEIMPLVRIDLIEGKPSEYRATIGKVVYQCLLDVFDVPRNDRFQVITEHPKNGLQFDPSYLGIKRTDDCIFLQITLNAGRSVELKQQLYKSIAKNLHKEIGVRAEDIFINLVEVPKENWSYGNGDAQYVTRT